MPTPAVNAGSIASPLLTRKGPSGRTVAVSPAALLKCQVSPGVEMYAMHRCSERRSGCDGRPYLEK